MLAMTRPSHENRKSVEHHIMTGTYRPCRHGPRPCENNGPSIWDTVLALPDAPPKDATLPQEELEAAALPKMGWSHLRRE